MTDDSGEGWDQWDWDDGPDIGDSEDTPTGTDADFSGDTTTSLPVADDVDGPDERFDRLAQDAAENTELRLFLNGARRAVLVHKSHQFADRLDEVVGYARRQATDRCSVGLVLPFRQSRDAMRSFMGAFPNTAIRFADPEIHLHANHYDQVKSNALKHWAYFRDPVPDPADRDWTLELLARQAAVGATVLLTPTGKVEEANAQASLDNAMDRIALARSLVGGSPMFANLTFDHRWLSQPFLRNRLLGEIVDSSERHWYLRFRWPIVEPRYGQLNDQAILDGYAELTAVCAEEEKILVLPNSDLTGWVMTALGATGFGTATSISDRYFADRRIIRSRRDQPKPEAKKRYFSKRVLHTLEQPTHYSLLSEPGYDRCGCRFCTTTLRPDRQAPADWDRAAVGYHYVQKAVMLTASLGTNARLRARRRVRGALRFVAALPPAKELADDDRPQHLDSWRSLLN